MEFAFGAVVEIAGKFVSKDVLPMMFSSERCRVPSGSDLADPAPSLEDVEDPSWVKDISSPEWNLTDDEHASAPTSHDNDAASPGHDVIVIPYSPQPQHAYTRSVSLSSSVMSEDLVVNARIDSFQYDPIPLPDRTTREMSLSSVVEEPLDGGTSSDESNKTNIPTDHPGSYPVVNAELFASTDARFTNPLRHPLRGCV